MVIVIRADRYRRRHHASLARTFLDPSKNHQRIPGIRLPERDASGKASIISYMQWFRIRPRSAQETSIMPQRICLSEIPSGVSAMDKLHKDFFAALVKLSSASDYDFCAGFTAFVSQVEQAFRLEEQWMEDIDFPGFGVHQEQHARVLGALHNAHGHVMDGDLRLGREVTEKLLPQWCAFHMATMDRSLALAMQMAHFQAARP